MWGEFDNMMPAAQTQRFAYSVGTDDVEIQYVPQAGHFAATDNPRFAGDALVNFVRRVAGREALAGRQSRRPGHLEGGRAGDDRRDLRAIYGITVESALPLCP